MRTYTYERVPIRRKQTGGVVDGHRGHEPVSADVPAEDHYRLSDHDLAALGGGDIEAGHVVLSSMFPYMLTEKGVIPSWAVAILGHGEAETGKKILDKFSETIRAKDHGEKS